LNSHAELCKPPLRLKRLLYDPGDTASSMIHDDRRALRQVEAIPELRQFREWMGIDKDGIPFEDSTLHGLPLKRSLAKMIRYARASWKVLKVYTTHGRLTIDNDTVRSRCMAPDMRVDTETLVQIGFTGRGIPDSLTVAARLSTQQGERGCQSPVTVCNRPASVAAGTHRGVTGRLTSTARLA
jgi:hypothetical protein